MRILFVGPLWKGSTSRYRVAAFRALGCVVETVDSTPADRAREFSLPARVLRALGAPPDLSRANRGMRQAAAAAPFDLVWVERGLTIRPGTLRAVRAAHPHVRLVSFSLDDMLNPRNQSRAYLGSLPLYDVHVTTKTYNVGELRGLGARDALFVPNAYDPATHRPRSLSAAERAHWGSDVSFVGQYERERFEMMLALAQAGIRVTVFGPDWERRRRAHPNLEVRDPWVTDDDYARVISATRVNLGFLRKANRDLQTTRSVEIPACGGFLLAERTDQHRELFEEGVEAEYFAGVDELIDKTRRYLADEPARARIGAAGRERCLHGGYAYADRLRAVLRHLGLDERRSGGGVPADGAGAIAAARAE